MSTSPSRIVTPRPNQFAAAPKAICPLRDTIIQSVETVLMSFLEAMEPANDAKDTNGNAQIKNRRELGGRRGARKNRQRKFEKLKPEIKIRFREKIAKNAKWES
jgi:hypothetical protein